MAERSVRERLRPDDAWHAVSIALYVCNVVVLTSVAFAEDGWRETVAALAAIGGGIFGLITFVRALRRTE